MLRSIHSRDPHILTSHDLDLLQTVFDEQIKARGLKCDCDEANAIARRLVELFQAGVREIDQLQNVLKAA
ncbi:hypothetical protein CO661_00325 [Sinorhizobium fredii]|uniref:Uncharacterized protein n=1 Tax=Rhizobium fredii TaxID=380 RepID=A0A2A6M6Y3_RHIFR|nr:hypothetical protein [Sinorhizobium fredii]PDT50149.1 hypothetical protein CO661_00325 [Sinorhizobium fredii]